MKGLGETSPFIGLLILDVINRFIFCHGVVIYNLLYYVLSETAITPYINREDLT